MPGQMNILFIGARIGIHVRFWPFCLSSFHGYLRARRQWANVYPGEREAILREISLTDITH